MQTLSVSVQLPYIYIVVVVVVVVIIKRGKGGVLCIPLTSCGHSMK